MAFIFFSALGSTPTDRRFLIECLLLTHDLALSASQLVHEAIVYVAPVVPCWTTRALPVLFSLNCSRHVPQSLLTQVNIATKAAIMPPFAKPVEDCEPMLRVC